MTGDQFLASLNAAIAPRTVSNMLGKDKHMLITLSDGKQIEVKRKAVRDAEDQSELDAYIAGLLG